MNQTERRTALERMKTSIVYTTGAGMALASLGLHPAAPFVILAAGVTATGYNTWKVHQSQNNSQPVVTKAL